MILKRRNKIMRMKCCVVAIVICLSVLFGFVNASADDSISESLKKGKMNGELKVWYQTNDNDAGDNNIFNKENSIFDAGLGLGYTTGTYRSFSAKVNFFAIDDLSAYDNFANNSTHGVDHSETAAWLGEAFLSYKAKNTLINIGRQTLKSPLVNSDGWAVFPNTFEAILVQNSDIQDTTVAICYVTEERKIKGDKFEDIAENGGLMLGVINKSLPDTTLSGYYYHVDDVSDVNALYLDATTRWNLINLAGQYMLFDPDMFNAKKTNAFGFKVSSKVGMFDLSAAYSTVDDGTLNAARFTDNGCKTPLYTATMSGDADIAGATDTDSYKFSFGLTPTDSLIITASFGYYDHGGNSSAMPNDESTSKELTVKYTGFENVTIFGAYINSDHNGIGGWRGATIHDDLNSIRIWASYKF
jgi:hypothetical protein